MYGYRYNYPGRALVLCPTLAAHGRKEDGRVPWFTCVSRRQLFIYQKSFKKINDIKVMGNKAVILGCIVLVFLYIVPMIREYHLGPG